MQFTFGPTQPYLLCVLLESSNIFAFEQVGTNCGLIGKNAAVEVDGAAYWMSENGFFKYTGKLESMDCLVEDYVYDNLNTTSNQMIYAGVNNLFGEVVCGFIQLQHLMLSQDRLCIVI